MCFGIYHALHRLLLFNQIYLVRDRGGPAQRKLTLGTCSCTPKSPSRSIGIWAVSLFSSWSLELGRPVQKQEPGSACGGCRLRTQSLSPGCAKLQGSTGKFLGGLAYSLGRLHRQRGLDSRFALKDFRAWHVE